MRFCLHEFFISPDMRFFSQGHTVETTGVLKVILSRQPEFSRSYCRDNRSSQGHTLETTGVLKVILSRQPEFSRSYCRDNRK